jgi:acetoin utilization deacetylase AcuC-like enzyme
VGRDAEAYDGIGHLDGDTTVSHGSFAAALHAAGSVCQAIDLVVNGEVGREQT